MNVIVIKNIFLLYYIFTHNSQGQAVGVAMFGECMLDLDLEPCGNRERYSIIAGAPSMPNLCRV